MPPPTLLLWQLVAPLAEETLTILGDRVKAQRLQCQLETFLMRYSRAGSRTSVSKAALYILVQSWLYPSVTFTSAQSSLPSQSNVFIQSVSCNGQYQNINSGLFSGSYKKALEEFSKGHHETTKAVLKANLVSIEQFRWEWEWESVNIMGNIPTDL